MLGHPPRTCGLCDSPTTTGLWCSLNCEGTHFINHDWKAARETALDRDDRACVRCGVTELDAKLEVNHRQPRRGQGYRWGCHNHLDNLETLCHDCHVRETRLQRRGLPSWREIDLLEAPW